VSSTLVNANTDVNTDGHQSSKISGRAHAPNAPDPLRQLFAAAPPPSATWIADNIEDHLTGGEDHAPRGPLSRLYRKCPLPQ
jgi:hypothetical protein